MLEAPHVRPLLRPRRNPRPIPRRSSLLPRCRKRLDPESGLLEQPIKYARKGAVGAAAMQRKVNQNGCNFRVTIGRGSFHHDFRQLLRVLEPKGMILHLP